MKELLCLFLLLFFLAPETKAQVATYSNKDPQVNFLDKVQLIANIAGYHHLLVMRRKQKPIIYIYDQQLNLQGQKELDANLLAEDEVQVLAYKTFYYLLSRSVTSRKRTLWKISATGKSIDHTSRLNQLLYKQVGDSNTTVKIVSGTNRFYIMKQRFLAETGLVEMREVIADSLLQLKEIRQVTYPFAGERTHQLSILNDDQLLVLSTGTKNRVENFIKLTNINTKTGNIIATNYKSMAGTFLQPRFYYYAADSTILLYSYIQQSYYDGTKSFFISRFSDSLIEITPASIQKITSPNFFALVDGHVQQWVGFAKRASIYFLNRGDGQYRLPNSVDNVTGTENDLPLFRITTPGSNNNLIGSIQFSIMNTEFKTADDSLKANEKKKFQILTDTYAQFEINGKGYLMLKQRFPSKGMGLLLVSGNETKGLQWTDARVYDRYDYLLDQLQQSNDGSVLIPFLHKQEAGIIRLKIQSE